MTDTMLPDPSLPTALRTLPEPSASLSTQVFVIHLWYLRRYAFVHDPVNRSNSRHLVKPSMRRSKN